jgi:hypothetical protein
MIFSAPSGSGGSQTKTSAKGRLDVAGNRSGSTLDSHEHDLGSMERASAGSNMEATTA